MLRELLQESSVAEILREEAEAKGLAEGEAKGLAEGEAKGQRALLRAILESRIGPLDASELAALGVASPSVLQSLAGHITTDSRELVRARLGLA